MMYPGVLDPAGYNCKYCSVPAVVAALVVVVVVVVGSIVAAAWVTTVSSRLAWFSDTTWLHTLHFQDPL